MINIKQFERPFQDEFQLECHARNVNQDQTHASTAFNVNDVANWLMHSLIHDRKILKSLFRISREKICIKSTYKKKKKRSLFYQATKSYLAVIPFFTSFSFFNLVFFKRTLPSRAEEKRDRKREEFVSRVKQI